MQTQEHIVAGTRIELKMCQGSGAAPFDSIVSLRAECWREHIQNLLLLDDGHDAHAMHWWVEVAGEVVAAARLCVHSDLKSVPSSHLYQHTTFDLRSGEVACINRLVVAPAWRGKGLGRMLDSAREKTARDHGCKWMVAVWNPASGNSRRAALLALGFVSLTKNDPVPDGKFGSSFPFGKMLNDDDRSPPGKGFAGKQR